MQHRHRALPSKRQTCGYQHAVRNPENRAAHGNVCHTDYCRCGALRMMNANGRHREVGPWITSPADSDFAHYGGVT